MNKRQFWIIIFLAFIFLPVVWYLFYTFDMHNPFPEVEWIEDYPGATDRYVTYTPVLKSNHSIKVGPTVGADFAKLRFKDLDKDGVKEAIVETEILFDFNEYRFPQRYVLKYLKTSNDSFEFSLIESQDFPEKIPDGY